MAAPIPREPPVTIARFERDGAVRVLATLPLPADGGVNTPLGGAAAPTGITRATDGTIFFAYAAGDSRLTGLWALRPGKPPRRIAALPVESFPNGIALNEATGEIYVADSVLGTVWKVPRRGGAAQAWSGNAALAPVPFIGANGLKVHRGAVWVSNTDAGTLLRIPIARDGSAGPVRVRATGLTGIDDFAFTGRGDKVLAALFTPNRVVLVDGYGPGRTVLDATDGTQNPTAIAVYGSAVVVTNSARGTGVDPNLITARLSTKRR
jgi:DNA-binding beta-propeller fold protein YncE